MVDPLQMNIADEMIQLAVHRLWLHYSTGGGTGTVCFPSAPRLQESIVATLSRRNQTCKIPSGNRRQRISTN